MRRFAFVPPASQAAVLLAVVMAFSTLPAGLSVAADPTTEPPAVTQLRQRLLNGPASDEPASRLIEKLVNAEGAELYDTYLAVALRRDEALPHIARTLTSAGPAAKRKITKLIRYTGITGTTPQLMDIIASQKEHPVSRIGAMYALGALGHKPAAPAMLRLLDDPSRSPTEKRVIIAVLAQLNHRPAVPAIRKFTTNDDELVRIFAIRALAELGDTPDIEPLLQSSRSPDFIVRQTACGALGSCPGPQAIETLTTLAADDFSQLVREQAQLGLVRIEAAAMDQDQMPEFLDILIDHPAKHVRAWAVRSLANEQGRRGQGVLRKALADGRREKERIAALLLILPNAGPDFRGGF